MDADIRRLNAIYYATVLLIAAGLTALWGYEIGWLAARSTASLAVAGLFAPCVVYLASEVSKAATRSASPTNQSNRRPPALTGGTSGSRARLSRPHPTCLAPRRLWAVECGDDSITGGIGQIRQQRLAIEPWLVEGDAADRQCSPERTTTSGDLELDAPRLALVSGFKQTP